MPTFKTRARAVDMLGRQQIAGVPNAISELFKNAYDAYADHVEVDFFLSDGLFVLRDDGIGMTRKEFEERWLTLGTESKLGSQFGMEPPPRDPRKPHRSISGEKGIGRLAIAAIGPQVLVLTRAGRGTERHNLVAAFIHWGFFEIPGINLDDIDIPVTEFAGGSIPNRSDLRKMTKRVRMNLERIATKLPEQAQRRISHDLDRFDFNPREMIRFLSKKNSLLDLGEVGHGTHFFILPTVSTLIDDISFDSEEKEDISRLRRLLLGFTDTASREYTPEIETAFRCWNWSLGKHLLLLGGDSTKRWCGSRTLWSLGILITITNTSPFCMVGRARTEVGMPVVIRYQCLRSRGRSGAPSTQP